MKNVIIDTNVLLDGLKVSDFENVVIPIIVIEELDKLKRSNDQEVAYKARQAIIMLENATNIEVLWNSSFSFPLWLKDSNDNQIICFAKDIATSRKDYMFLSNDVNVRLKAKQLDIPCIGYGVKKNSEIYKGYRELSGNTDFINNLLDGSNKPNFLHNEYLILHNLDLDNIIEYRYDSIKNKFLPLKLPNSKIIKGLNSQQRCALDLLLDKNIGISALLGKPGSGKTYMSLRMALYHANEAGNVSKVVVIREPVGEGNAVGFLKGDFADKTADFFKPIQHSLEGGEFQLQALIQRGVLETNIPYYLKGTTYNSSYLVVDEAADLTAKQIKMIGTRVGKDSQISFVGDYKQSVNNPTINNPLIQMCNKLKGNYNFGCIVLEEDVRSEISKVFADLL